VVQAPAQDPALREDFWIRTRDGQRLRATLRLPRDGERPVPVVLLMHQLGADRGSFETLGARLVGRGMAALSVDLRGHGESASARLPSSDALLDPGNQALWLGIYEDGEALLRAARSHPDLDGSSVALVGASIGAGVAGWMAADHARTIAGVVSLSPGPGWRLPERLERAGRTRGVPTWYVVAQGDTRSSETVDRLLAASSPRDARKRVVRGGAHGTEMFRERPELMDDVVDFLVERLLGDGGGS